MVDVPDFLPEDKNEANTIAKMRAALDNMKRMGEINADFSKEYAKHIKIRYDHYVEAGFTEEQALKIVITRGIL